MSRRRRRRVDETIMLLLPAIAKVGEKEARFLSREALLRTALRAHVTGTNAWETTVVDGAGKISHRSLGDAGYELSVLPEGSDTPETLVVGNGGEVNKP